MVRVMSGIPVATVKIKKWHVAMGAGLIVFVVLVVLGPTRVFEVAMYTFKLMLSGD